MKNESYTIHNDVLLTNSGTAFLIGGNHSVLNYITEELKPTVGSFENFKDNISRRSYFAHLGKTKYLHVIFPDKQSILQKEFPILNTIRLGDKYTQHLGASPFKKFILYPTMQLQKSSAHKNYQELDTHLSDHGSLLVLEEILKTIDEPAPEALADLKISINIKKRSHGDLGEKFTPKLLQESTHLKPVWNYRHYSSNGSFNNGQVDIYLNPKASIPKKVLIFGDSFFRLMLLHLSRVFREVVFLRTPYVHN